MQHILKTLIEFPTVTADQAANRQAIEWIEHFLSERGMHIQRHTVNGFESLVATTRPTKTPKVLLAAHLDVVPGNPEDFAFKIKDGRYYGRGTADMKYAIAAYLQLVDDLRADLGTYDFGIMLTCDEEFGGVNGTEFLLNNGYGAEVVILPDGGDTPTSWKLERSAKGMLSLRVTTTGKSAHGSRPWKGENAVDKLIRLLQEIQADFRDQTPDTNTLNLGVISGGSAYNQIPDRAEAQLDIRTLSDEDAEQIRSRIKQICTANEAQLEPVVPYGNACRADKTNPLVAAFLQKLYKIADNVSELDSYGSSDARFFAAKKIPCIVLSPPCDGYHAPDEWMSVKGTDELLDLITSYIKEVARS